MDQTKKNAGGLDGRRKVVVMGEGAARCFMCVKRFESIKDLYDHISAGHSDSEWKAFFAQNKTTIINVGGRNKDLLSEWKVTGKRGRPGSKVAANDHPAFVSKRQCRPRKVLSPLVFFPIDKKLLEIAESLLLLASGPPKPRSKDEVEEGVEAPMKMQKVIDSRAGGCVVSKKVESASAMEESDFKRGRFMASTSKGEPQRLDDDFQGGRYFVVHDFDLNEDPPSTPPPMKDVEDRSM